MNTLETPMLLGAGMIEKHFEEMSELGTLEVYLCEAGYEREGDVFLPQVEVVGFESHALQAP